jgi:hypothetical protein
MDLKVTGMEGVNWIQLAQDKDQWPIIWENGNERLSSIQDVCNY